MAHTWMDCDTPQIMKKKYKGVDNRDMKLFHLPDGMTLRQFRKWRARIKYRKYQKKYYRKNKENILARARKYYWKTRDARLATRRIYDKKHRKQLNAYARKWRAKHKEK